MATQRQKTQFTGYSLAMQGYTLIELMLVVVIIAIFAAIAIPSYRQYTQRNAESEAMARMHSLQLDLDRWRASALTYKGFVPNGGYATTTNNFVYSPKTTSANSFRYQIYLLPSSGNSLVSTATSANPVNVVLGRGWMMFAEPNSSNSTFSGAFKFLLKSDGTACKTKDTNVTITTVKAGNCGTVDSQPW